LLLARSTLKAQINLGFAKEISVFAWCRLCPLESYFL